MTDTFAIEIVMRLCAMFALFGMVLFGANAQSTLSSERIKSANKSKRKNKKTAGKRKSEQRRGTYGGSTLNAKRRKPKTIKQRPLSEFNQGIYDNYKLGFDFPNFKATSNVPL